MTYRYFSLLWAGWQWFALLFALLIPGSLLANPAQTHEYTLSNGLKLIVREDHRSPVVISQIWYKAGSIDEVNGVTGVAHVLEHMMFKGTKRVPGGEFSRRIAAAAALLRRRTMLKCLLAAAVAFALIAAPAGELDHLGGAVTRYQTRPVEAE